MIQKEQSSQANSGRLQNGSLLEAQKGVLMLEKYRGDQGSICDSRGNRRVEKQIGKLSTYYIPGKDKSERNHSNLKQLQSEGLIESINLKRQKLHPKDSLEGSQALPSVDSQVKSLAKMYESLMGVTKTAMEKMDDQQEILEL